MDRYITVISNNDMSPSGRMKDLMTKVNEKAKEGYHIVGTPTDLHMYGTRWQTAIIMELDGSSSIDYPLSDDTIIDEHFLEDYNEL